MRRVTVPLPPPLRRCVDRHYIDVSIWRLLPLSVLIGYGVMVGLVFNTGLDHPWDKVQHVVFFALLTVAIHAFFCCRLRLSAGAALAMGLAGEIVQAFTPHHHASLLDMVANMVGVVLIVATVLLIRSETQAVLADPEAGPVVRHNPDHASDDHASTSSSSSPSR